MADKTYELTFELSDGSEKTVQFTAPQGAQGPQGPQGEPGEDAPQESVLYVVQALTDAQKAQARENIAAASRGVLLWSNASPTSSFSAQTLTIPGLSNYNLFKILVRYSSGSDTYSMYEIYAPETRTLRIDYAYPTPDTKNLWVTKRDVTFTPVSNAVEFAATYYGGTSTTVTIDNSRCIPVAIIGHIL